MSQFDIYGRMAVAGVTEMLQNGRYTSQKEAVQHVPDDVAKKLKINRDDTFFDIGCGLGLNLIPISKIARLAFACDHPNVIKMLRKKELPANISFYEGDFLNITSNRIFTKIHAYVLDQPQNLPFGNSREDILVVGPEYEDKE